VAIPLLIFLKYGDFFQIFFEFATKKKNNNDIGTEIPNPSPGNNPPGRFLK